jgi:hypothetical protein
VKPRQRLAFGAEAQVGHAPAASDLHAPEPHFARSLSTGEPVRGTRVIHPWAPFRIQIRKA